MSRPAKLTGHLRIVKKARLDGPGYVGILQIHGLTEKNENVWMDAPLVLRPRPGNGGVSEESNAHH